MDQAQAMLAECRTRTAALQARMRAAGARRALFTDEASIAWLAGFWGCLGVEFGRPTMLLVPDDGPPTVITPLMEADMVSAMTWVEDVRPWEDAGPRGWARVLAEALDPADGPPWVERAALPGLVRDMLDAHLDRPALPDIGPELAALRMVKSPLEIEIMRAAGRVAGAMMAAARDALAEGAPERACAQAVLSAGTEAAAGFLTERGLDRFVSPVIHGLPILQSGPDTAMVHRRASARRLRRGDAVCFCVCNLVQVRHHRLGFDRMFFVGEAPDAAARLQETAEAARAAALAAIRPGVRAEEVATAANAVYAAQGLAAGHRTGRAIGVGLLEAPELKAGDRTVLRPGMTFAVDGGVSGPGGAGRIGDSVVVTEDGRAPLTSFPKGLLVVERGA